LSNHSLPKDYVMSRAQAFLDRLPNPDEALRSLSDVLQVPLSCRKRACRRERRCQGGYGPPCYFAHRKLFSVAVREGMREFRQYWDEQRRSIEAVMRR
jgi:hypothetical protein